MNKNKKAAQNSKQHPTDGQRLKDAFAYLKQSRDDIHRQEDIAALLGVSPVTLSRYANNVRPMPDDLYKSLADKTGLRLEYLRGMDDFRTADDVRRAALADAMTQEQRRETFRQHIELQGYKVAECVTLHIFDAETLRRYWDKIKPTLKDRTLDIRLGNHKSLREWDGVNLSDLSAPIPEQYAGRDILDRWAGYPALESLFSAVGLSVQSTLQDFEVLETRTHNGNELYAETYYGITYTIEKDGNKETYTALEYDKLIDAIGSITRTLIDSHAYNIHRFPFIGE